MGPLGSAGETPGSPSGRRIARWSFSSLWSFDRTRCTNEVRVASLSHDRPAGPVQSGRDRFYQMLQRKAWISRASASAEKPKSLKRNAELRPKRLDPRTGEPRFSTFAKPTKPTLNRTRMKVRRRRAKPGDDAPYKAWIKTQPCVVCGRRGRGVDGHHLINGKGNARKGMGQTLPDKFLIPMCRKEHNQFHARVGFCKGWTDQERLTWQELEVERLQRIWADLRELGVLQEPERRTI